VTAIVAAKRALLLISAMFVVRLAPPVARAAGRAERRHLFAGNMRSTASATRSMCARYVGRNFVGRIDRICDQRSLE